jgi:hypothetical protein
MVALNSFVVVLFGVGALGLALLFSPHMENIANRVEATGNRMAKIIDHSKFRAIALTANDYNVSSLRSSARIGYDLAGVCAGVVLLASYNAVSFYRLRKRLMPTLLPEEAKI